MQTAIRWHRVRCSTLYALLYSIYIYIYFIAMRYWTKTHYKKQAKRNKETLKQENSTYTQHTKQAPVFVQGKHIFVTYIYLNVRLYKHIPDGEMYDRNKMYDIVFKNKNYLNQSSCVDDNILILDIHTLPYTHIYI